MVELAALARVSATGPVIAITHAFVIGCIVTAVLGAPAVTWLSLAPVNAGLTILDCTTDGITLAAYNDVGHLVS